jgi:hypothetical protein
LAETAGEHDVVIHQRDRSHFVRLAFHFQER